MAYTFNINTGQFEEIEDFKEKGAKKKSAIKLYDSTLVLIKGDKGDMPTHEEIRPIVKEEIAKIPLPKDGKSVEEEQIKRIAKEIIESFPKPKDGEDADPQEIRRLVDEAINALPKPKDGKSIDADEIKRYIDNAVNSLPKPKDGKSPSQIEIRKNQSQVQWRYTGGEWKDLFAIPKTKGGGGGASVDDLNNILVAGVNITLTTSSAGKITIASSDGAHNSLSGLQGGTAGEYYHLTSAEYTALGSGYIRLDGTTTTTASIPFAQGINTTKITNLTTNGFVKTSGGNGTLSIDTSTYLTSASADALYIRLDGTSTTTASIPFAEGLSFANTKSLFIGGTTAANSNASITSTTSLTTLLGYDKADTSGMDLSIIGGDATGIDLSGGMIRLHGGNYLAGGEGQQTGFVTTDTIVTSFTLNSTVGGIATIGNSIEDFYVGNNQYVAGNLATANGIGTNGTVLAGANYALLSEGNTARIIGMDRRTTGAGRNLTIQAGWAQNGGTNLTAGHLILAPGKSTGNGTGQVEIQTVTVGASGTADRTPSTKATWGSASVSFFDGYHIATGTITGTALGAKGTEKAGMHGTTAIQDAATADLGTCLSNHGLRAIGTTYTLTTSGTVTLNGTFIQAATAGGTTIGQRWSDSTQQAMAVYESDIKQMLVGCIFTQTADQTVSNTVAETTLLGTGIGTKTLPTNFFLPGKTIRLKVGGVYSTPALATPSLIINVKYGTTVIATVTTNALFSGATNLLFEGEVYITCRTAGAGGTVMTHGTVLYNIGIVGQTYTEDLNNAGATTTINTSNSNTIDISVQWDAATSTRSVTSIVSTMEVIN